MTKLNEPEAKLPEIALSDMPEKTKDFLIAHSAAGKSVVEVIRDVLNQAASSAVFTHPKRSEA